MRERAGMMVRQSAGALSVVCVCVENPLSSPLFSLLSASGDQMRKRSRAHSAIDRRCVLFGSLRETAALLIDPLGLSIHLTPCYLPHAAASHHHHHSPVLGPAIVVTGPSGFSSHLASRQKARL